MASKYAVFGFLEMVVMMTMLMSVTADLAKDRQECADQLVGLGTCLPYVGGQGKTPTIDCCAGLKQVLQKSKKCLCVLIKDRNDPNLGLKINATLAMGLPTACHAPTNVSECPALLQLPAGSPDAKIFEEYGNNSTASSSKSTSVASAKANSTSSGSDAQTKSDGGRRRRCLGVEPVSGVLFLIVSHVLISSV